MPHCNFTVIWKIIIWAWHVRCVMKCLCASCNELHFHFHSNHHGWDVDHYIQYEDQALLFPVEFCTSKGRAITCLPLEDSRLTPTPNCFYTVLEHSACVDRKNVPEWLCHVELVGYINLRDKSEFRSGICHSWNNAMKSKQWVLWSNGELKN
jgi:hypothetical protein